jgi:hypothetical protein
VSLRGASDLAGALVGAPSMILCRLAANLKQQNWTAIWIELVLLVAGVFIGIQVSNWNEERKVNLKAAFFSERLKAHLPMESWGCEYLIEHIREPNGNQRICWEAS